MSKQDREYFKLRYRVVRNTFPVGGPWRLEFGCWIPDSLRGKRDTFRVRRTVKVGTREECTRLLPPDEFQRQVVKL